MQFFWEELSMCKYESPAIEFLPFVDESVMTNVSYGDNYAELNPDWSDALKDIIPGWNQQ